MVLLIMSVALTLGLAVVSRSVTEINVSTTQEESSKALEAAEAGVENALGGVVAGPSGGGTLTGTNATFSVANTSVGGGGSYSTVDAIEPGDVITVDVTGTSQNIKLCWGTETGITPAVEVMLYYDNSGVKVARWGYDPQNSPVRPNGFDNGSDGNCTGGFNYSKNMTLTVTGARRYLRIRPLYNSTKFSLVAAGGDSFPTQGQDITSTGQAGSVSQKIHVTVSNSDLPTMFDNAIFSGTSLTK